MSSLSISSREMTMKTTERYYKQSNSTSNVFLLVLLSSLLHSSNGFFLHQSATKSTSLFNNKNGITIIEKSDEEWKEVLTSEQYYVLREEGTEGPNTSELNTIKKEGTFSCVACNEPLFTTETKFDSGTGWPSFYSPVDNNIVTLSTDFKMLLPRTECSCTACGGHLGHVFDDGPDPTGQRFCMNGVCMKFTSDEDDPELAASVLERQKLEPYKVGMTQVFQSVAVYLGLGGLTLNSFVVTVTNHKGTIESPTEILPLLLATYCFYMAFSNFGRAFISE